jgi:hypothetical protein
VGALLEIKIEISNVRIQQFDLSLASIPITSMSPNELF